MQVAENSMKKIVILFLFFAIYTSLVILCPKITSWDRAVILQIQALLENVPPSVPKSFDRVLYSFMVVFPVIWFGVYFLLKKKWSDAMLIITVPLAAFGVNSVIKELIQRPRPPYDLQMLHLESFSYVSSHTLITFFVWAVVIYYVYKLNLPMKKLLVLIGLVWSILIGFSRCWLGVHNPSDVIGAYLLGLLLFSIFLRVKERE